MEFILGKGRGGANEFSPTLDRKIPANGYLQGNVAIISFLANRMKRDCTDSAVFERLADWL